jgi:hypothetical protein
LDYQNFELSEEDQLPLNGKTHTGIHLGEPSIGGNVRWNFQSPCLALFPHKFHTSDPFRNKIQILDILGWSIQKGNECQ